MVNEENLVNQSLLSTFGYISIFFRGNQSKAIKDDGNSLFRYHPLKSRQLNLIVVTCNSGWPIWRTTKNCDHSELEIIAKVLNNILLDHRGVKICEITEVVGVMEDRKRYMMYEESNEVPKQSDGSQSSEGSWWIRLKESNVDFIYRNGQGQCLLCFQWVPFYLITLKMAEKLPGEYYFNLLM